MGLQVQYSSMDHQSTVHNGIKMFPLMVENETTMNSAETSEYLATKVTVAETVMNQCTVYSSCEAGVED